MHDLFGCWGKWKAIAKVGHFAETCWSEKKIVASSKVAIEDWYYNKESTHSKNERLYVGICFEINLCNLIFILDWKKIVQFATICHL
jgi:hypothetical protein